MPWWELLLILLGTMLMFAVIHFIAKNKRPFRRALLSMAVGLGMLFAINLTSGFTGVSIPVGVLSILLSAIGGIPGLTLTLPLNLLL